MRRRELLLALATGMMGARAVRAQQKAMPGDRVPELGVAWPVRPVLSLRSAKD